MNIAITSIRDTSNKELSHCKYSEPIACLVEETRRPRALVLSFSSMPRGPPPPQRNQLSPPPTASRGTNNSYYPNVEPSLLRLHLNQLREQEELLARLRERQQQYSSVPGPLSPHFDASLSPYLSQQISYSSSAAAATAAAASTNSRTSSSSTLSSPPLELLLASARQQQQQLGTPTSTELFLELARQHRPDLLPLLQANSSGQASGNDYYGDISSAQVTVGVGAAAAASTWLPGDDNNLAVQKRKRPYEAAGSGEKHRDEDQRDDSEEEGDAKEPAVARPRKRVMFDVGDVGDTGEVGEGDGFGHDHNKTMPNDDGYGGSLWDHDTHRKFVEAVFETGIRHASPSVLLNLMVNARNFPLTSERVKSRLQKYRNSSDKSRADFMEEYNTFLQRAMSIGVQSSGSRSAKLLPISRVLQIMGQAEPLYGGDAAAAATYEIFSKDVPGQQQHPANTHINEARFDSTVQHLLTPSFLKQESTALTQNCNGQILEVPRLTEEEKASPIGSSLGHVMGTFAALSKELDRQRVESDTPAMSDKARADHSTAGPKAPPDSLKDTPSEDEKQASAESLPPTSTDGNDTSAKLPPPHRASTRDTEATMTTTATTMTEADNDGDDDALKIETEKGTEQNTDPIEAIVALMYQSQMGKQVKKTF